MYLIFLYLVTQEATHIQLLAQVAWLSNLLSTHRGNRCDIYKARQPPNKELQSH